LLPGETQCDREAVARALDFLANEWLADVAADFAGKATPKDYRVAIGHAAWNVVEGDSGAGRCSLDSLDDRHISDSRTVHGG
jgi:hypothetical protein